MSNSKEIPRRIDLIEHLQKANRFAWPLVIAQILGIAVISTFVDWERIPQEPLVSLIAIAVAAGPTSFEIIRYWSAKRTRVQDLKEQTRFGRYDKHLLQSLYADTLKRLGIPDLGVPLFIVADRSMNAAAMHLGFGSFFRSINGVYLHRQLLHKLEPTEVQDTIGHELGHYYKYYLLTDRFRIVTITLAVLGALVAVQMFGIDGILGYVLITIIPMFVLWVSRLPYINNAKAIEFLCDDLGAHVGGVIPSINALMKLGAEAELHSIVMQQAVLSKAAGVLDASEVMEAVSQAIPYGSASREDIEKRVHAELKKRVDDRQVSVTGFLKYVWNSEQEAAVEEMLEEEVKQIKRLQSVPRHDWEALLMDPANIDFDEESLPMLIKMIELEPSRYLFRLAEGNDQSDGVHPPIKSRILYLWYNRDEIEEGIRCKV